MKATLYHKWWMLVALVLTPLAVRADLYIADGDQIGRYDSSTGAVINADFIDLYSVTGLVIGPNGHLYAGSLLAPPSLAPGIMEYNATTGAMIGTGPLVSYIDDNTLVGPEGLAFDLSGNLFVGDGSTNVVHVYTPAGGIQPALIDPGLSAPYGIQFSTSGNLFIANTNGGNVTRYSSGTFSNFFPVTPGSPTVSATQYLTVGNDGFAYVLDTGTFLSVWKVALNDGNNYTKILDFHTDTFTPAGIAYGPDGNLYLSGVDNFGEVLRFDTNGGNRTTFVTGLGFFPSYMAFSTVPEPGTSAVIASVLALGMAGWVRRFKRNGK